MGADRIVRWARKDHHKFCPEAREFVLNVILIADRLQTCRSRSRLPPLPIEVWEIVISMRRVILLARPVDVLAGTGTSGYKDGPPSAAQLGLLSGVAVHPEGGVVVADWTNNRIRRISSEGTVETLAGSGHKGHRDAAGESARFNNPTAIVVSHRGELLVADTDNHAIRCVSSLGAVSTLAGSKHGGAGWFKDGRHDEARFDHPAGVTVSADGTVFVADTDNHRVRRISTGGTVSTFAGSGVQGHLDGPASIAKFRYPQGIAVDRDGNVVISERFDHRIRQISPSGTVKTLAGSGEEGFCDGNGEDARFNRPWGITADPDGGFLVADTYNHCIRRIQLDGSVSTAFADGHPPFHFPRGISIDKQSGAFIVGETHRIQRVGVSRYSFA